MTQKTDITKEFQDKLRELRNRANENGNRLYYPRGVLQVAVTGPLKLIGPQLIPVMGGAAAFWVRTEPEDSDKPDGSAAPAIITLRTDRPEIRACRIRVTADN